jgi:hypothetical protein
MIYVDKGKQFPLNSAHPTQSKECSADSNTSQSTNTIMPANQQMPNNLPVCLRTAGCCKLIDSSLGS